MVLEPGEYLLVAFMVVCRIGSCLTQLPGFSSARVPARVRLFVALALAVMITPMLVGVDTLKRGSIETLLTVVCAECLVGASIGLVSRIYMAALEFTSSAVSNYIGLSGLGTGIDHDEPAATVSTLVTMAATVVLLLMDFHRLMISILVDSYISIPIGVTPNAAAGLNLLVDTLGAAFILGLQVSAPFLIYGVLVNLIFGILGKLIPQVPSYFVSVPFLAIGGLLILHFSITQIMILFSRGVEAGLLRL